MKIATCITTAIPCIGFTDRLVFGLCYAAMMATHRRILPPIKFKSETKEWFRILLGLYNADDDVVEKYWKIGCNLSYIFEHIPEYFIREIHGLYPDDFVELTDDELLVLKKHVIKTISPYINVE